MFLDYSTTDGAMLKRTHKSQFGSVDSGQINLRIRNE